MTKEAREAASANGNFETGDQVFQVLPERRAFNSALTRGELPLWWPEAGGGISLLGAPGAELLEPRALFLSLIFGDVGSLAIQAALTIFVLAALSYWWFRLKDISIGGSVAGAIIFALGGALTSNLYYICKVDSMVILPAGLVAVELWYRNRRATSILVLGLGAADSILSSFPQNTALSIYCIILYVIYQMFERRELGLRAHAGAALALGAALAAGMAVGAIHLLPVAEWAREAQRSGAFGDASFRAGPAHWISMVAPLVLGNPASPSANEANPVPWILPLLQTPGGHSYNFTETTMYAGFGAIPLLLAGALRGRRTVIGFVILLFCLGVAAGTPLAHLPGVNISAPSRALAGAGFFVAWLAAEGLDGMVFERRPRLGIFAGIFILMFVALSAALVRSQFEGQSDTVADNAFNRMTAVSRAESRPAPPPKLLKTMEKRYATEIEPELLYVLLGALGAAAVASLALETVNGRRLLTLMIAADLCIFAMRILPAQERRGLLPETPAMREIRREAGDARIARVAPDEFPMEEDWWLLQASISSYLNIHDTSAYVIFPNANQVNVAAAFAPASLIFGTFLGAFPLSSLDTALPDLLGVKVVLCRAKLDRPDLEPVVVRPGLHVYRRKNALGRAWVAPVGKIVRSDAEMKNGLLQKGFDPQKIVMIESLEAPLQGDRLGDAGAGGGIVQIKDLSSRQVSISVRGTRGGFIVESAPLCPGWTATLDGFPTPALRANRYGRAVWVPEGDHEVVFTFMPRSFLWGSLISLLGLLFIPVLAWRVARSA